MGGEHERLLNQIASQLQYVVQTVIPAMETLRKHVESGIRRISVVETQMAERAPQQFKTDERLAQGQTKFESVNIEMAVIKSAVGDVKEDVSALRKAIEEGANKRWGVWQLIIGGVISAMVSLAVAYAAFKLGWVSK